MQISWRTSPAVTCYHVAKQVRYRRPLADSSLEEALREPVSRLRSGLAEERLNEERFWQLVIPLAGEFSSPRQLAETVLIKMMGRVEAQPRAGRFERALDAIRSASQKTLSATLPPAHDGLLHQAWAIHSAGLLGGIENWTEPELLVDSAIVYLLPDLSGGGGEAHLAFNSARVEQIGDSTGRPLEVLRLAWLVSQLNLDVPRFSESVTGERKNLIAALSMIPVSLAAGEFARIATCNAGTIRQAVDIWLGPHEQVPHWQAAVVDWWEVYKLQRPPWPAAIQALDGLL